MAAHRHHQDDQLETLLLALKRGAGLRGLAGILPRQPFAGGQLLRPLLDISRSELAEVAATLPYGWVEDESNRDVSYDRNFLRQELIPRLKARWPAMAQTASRTMAICAEQEALLEELAAQDWHLAGEGEALHIAALQPLSTARRNNLLRYWIRRQGGEMPSREQLNRLWQEVALARGDANPQLNWGKQSCRRFQDRLYLVTPDLQPCQQVLPLTTGEVISLPDGLGTLLLRRQTGGEGLLRLPGVTNRSRCAFRCARHHAQTGRARRQSPSEKTAAGVWRALLAAGAHSHPLLWRSGGGRGGAFCL